MSEGRYSWLVRVNDGSFLRIEADRAIYERGGGISFWRSEPARSEYLSFALAPRSYDWCSIINRATNEFDGFTKLPLKEEEE